MTTREDVTKAVQEVQEAEEVLRRAASMNAVCTLVGCNSPACSSVVGLRLAALSFARATLLLRTKAAPCPNGTAVAAPDASVLATIAEIEAGMRLAASVAGLGDLLKTSTPKTQA